MQIFPTPALAYCAIGCTLNLFSTTVAAMRITPIVFDMTAAGAGSKKTITVTSTEAKPLPVELVITPVDLDANGKHIALTNGEDDLMIFPPQAVIPPGATQTFRVQWIGDPQLAKSQSYSISINQVPVQIDMPEAQPDKIHTAMQVVLNFSVFATVRPVMGSSTFKIRSVEIEGGEQPVKTKHKKGVKTTPSPQTKPKVALVIENEGNLHNYFCNAVLTLQAGSWSKTYAPAEIVRWLGPGIVLPQHTRRFLLNIDDLPAHPGKVTATIDMGDRVGLPY